MPFKTFSAGDVLTDTDLNDYLMKQANIIGTSGGPPSTTTEGMLRADTDTDTVYRHNGTSWVEVGRYNTANTTMTMGGAYTATTNQVYRRGMWCWFTLVFNRPGAVNTGGVEVLIGTLPSGYWPAVTFNTAGASLSGVTCTFTVDSTDGEVYFRPSADVAAGNSIVVASGAYPLA